MNIGIASAQIEVTDSTSTGWGGGTNVDVTPGKPTGKVTSLSLSQNRLLLSGGQTTQLVAAVNADAANKSVTWSVTDNSIATVSANGLVTAVTTGQTVVTATSVDGGLTAQCLVTVKNNAKVYVERITLDMTELEMYVGEKKAVTPTVYPDNATDKSLRWETRGMNFYNPALPDENNVFTAYKPGVIELRIYPNDGSEAYAVCKVTVKDRPLTKMTLPKEIELSINELKTLTPEVTPELFQKKFKWAVADPSIAYITSSGRIIGIKAGTTTVTATALDGTSLSASCKVTVKSTESSLGYSGWILERGEDVHPWTARFFHETGYFGDPAPDDSKGNKWYSPDYDDSSWGYAYGPLMHQSGGQERVGYGQWELLDWSRLAVRQQFYLPDVSGYDFKVYAKEICEVYVNGHRVYITDNIEWDVMSTYMAFIDPSYLVKGGLNTVAICGTPWDWGSWQYLDFGIHYETTIPVTRVVIKQKQLTMARASSAKLEAIVKPQEATHQELTWSSSDETVATVHQDGTVTSLRPGTAVITATTTDGTNLSAKCTVTVTDEWGEEEEVTLYPWGREVLTFHQSRDKGFLTDANGKSFSELGYDETGWEMCRLPFRHAHDNPNFTPVEETNQRYFVRQHFYVPDIRGKYVVRLHNVYNYNLCIYCNGTLTYNSCEGRDVFDIPADLIKHGEYNVIAMSVENSGYVEFDNAISLFKIIPVTSVTMSETALTLNQNETARLSVTVLPENAYNRKVKWTSSEPTIASVDQDGNVMGMGEGKAIITATSLDGTEIAASCEVTVTNMKIDQIWVKPKGQDSPWTAKYKYCLAGDELFNNGPNRDGNGKAWTAKDYDDSAWETIRGPIGNDMGEIFWPDDNSRYYLRETFHLPKLSDFFHPQLALDHDDGIVVWVNGMMVHERDYCFTNYSVDIPDGILVEGTNVICVQVSQGGGGAYIDYGISVTELVEVVPANGITLDKTSVTLKRNEKVQLTATISPDNAYYKDVKWTSSNPEIVVVDENGNIRGVSAGEAVITVNNKHGKLFTATCKVTVNNEIAPVKVDDWVIGIEDEWNARILLASNDNYLFTHEPAHDTNGRKWTDYNYDDAKWTEIVSPMDKEHGYFPDNSRYYVRSKFAVGDLSAVNSMRLWMAHDDEAQVYINGIFVADFGGAGTDERTIPSGIFVEGDNIICVNIHQGGGDAYLDFALRGSNDEVYYTPVESVTLDKQQLTLVPGEKRHLNASVMPENADYRELAWASDDNDVVKVTADGEVTAQKEGAATVTVRNIMTGIEAQCKILVVPSTVSQTLSLGTGWNWISHYLSAPISLDWLSAAERIMSQTEENYNDPQLGMTGSIKTLDPGRAYKVKTASALSTTVSGVLHQQDSAPIAMEEGWNWVSFPFYQPLPLQDAVPGAEEGDYMVSLQDGFAEYVNGEWFGKLSVLSPGNGYLYKSSSGKSFEVDVYAASQKAMTAAKAVMTAENASADAARAEAWELPWSVDAHAYPNMMCITADFFEGDSKAEADKYCIAAFCGDECRGVGEYVKGIIFLSVYGDKSVPLTFLAADRATGEVYGIRESVDFNADVLGSVKAPFAFHLGEPTGVEATWAEGVQMQGITNLLGQKVNRTDVPGIYIINGKKVMIGNRRQ